MKIAINGLGVDGGGGKTYLENFLPELLNVPNNFHYFVFIRKSAENQLPVRDGRITYVPIDIKRGPLNRFSKEQLWIPGWLKKNKIDLLYSLADSTALLSPCPVVLAMRNLNLYVDREKGWSLPFELKFKALSLFARFSSSLAKKIIFVSDTSRKTIAGKLRIPEKKQRVIYHGLSPRFFERDKTLPGELEWLPNKTPYILSVSSVYRYKNFVRLIDGFAKARRTLSRDYHLIIAGKIVDQTYFLQMKKTIADNRLESRVHLAGEVPYSCLPALYRRAKLFVFPSYLETFGHPLVEAMASGVPIAAADIENSREITGQAALFFPPEDTAALAMRIQTGLEEDSVKRKLIEAALTRVKTFSWERCARETVTVFQQALDEN